jgi:hypothetical protein
MVTAAQEEAAALELVGTPSFPPPVPPPLLFEPGVVVDNGVPLPVAVTIHEQTDDITAG